MPRFAELRVEVTKVVLLGAEDGGALGLLDRAEVEILDPAAAAGQSGAVVIDYTRAAADPQADPLVLPATGLDVAPYIESGSVRVHLRLQGEVPADAWSLSAQICFHVHAVVDYTQTKAASN